MADGGASATWGVMNPTPLAFIGLGRLGAPLAVRLLAVGHTVAGYDLDPARVGGVPDLQPAGSPAEATRRSDIVLLCVTDAKAVAAAVLGPGGVREAAAPGKLLVDLSTTAPRATRDVAARLVGETGMRWVDAPVSGGVAGARDGTLVAFCGGADGDVARARPILAAFAARVTHMGPLGAGQITKLCNQMLVGTTLAVLAEAFALGRHAGIDVTRLPQALAGGFADSPPLRTYGPRMAARNFHPPAGAAGIMLKDLDEAMALARNCGAPAPMSATAAEILRLHIGRDGPLADTASVARLYDTADDGVCEGGT